MEQTHPRLNYLKNVLGIKSIILPKNYRAEAGMESSNVSVAAPARAHSKNAEFYFQTANKGNILFLADAKDASDKKLSIDELQLLEKIIVSLKLKFQRTDIAKVFTEKPDRKKLSQDILSKGYSHVFILGDFLGKIFSGSQQWISNELEIEGLIVFTTFHPDELLKNPDLKKDAWQFFKIIMERLPQ